MNRRGFLGLLAGATASSQLDPEKLLWVPGQKVISIPKPSPLLWRIPIKFITVANIESFNLDGGDWGIGSEMTITYDIVPQPSFKSPLQLEDWIRKNHACRVPVEWMTALPHKPIRT